MYSPSVAMACGANLSQACNKIAKNMKIFGDVAHFNISSHQNFQGNPIRQSLAICLGSSWHCKPLQHYSHLTKQFELKVDASGYVVGAVLMQRQPDGKRHPVGFYLATLNPAEHNYDIYDLKLLAIVKALQHWRPLLARSPHKIKVFSDHMNLQ